MPVASWIAEVRRQLGRAGVRGALQNISWLTGERVLQMGVGMVVGVWMARTLGPERFGVYNYALAFSALFGAAANLGTDSVVVRDLVRHPDRAHTILGTALRLRGAGALGVTGVLAVVAVVLYRHEPLTLTLILVFGATTLLRPFDVADLWFQARAQMSPAVRARSLAFLFASAGRAAVLFSTGGSLVALAVVEPLAAVLGALLLLNALRGSTAAPGRWGWDRAAAADLLRESWPLLVAGMGIIVYMRIDQVMIENLAGGGTHELGLYSAALRLSESVYVLPTAVVTAVFPHIVHAKNQGPEAYAATFARLFSIMTALALAVALPITLVARPLVTLVFGSSYAGAAPILAVHIWTALFVFWGVLSSAWVVSEGITRVTLVRALQGAVLNVLLNLWFIPRHGALGAAVATLLSQACAVCLLQLTDPVTRPLFRMQVRSLLMSRLLR